jgi:hypothetical protein
MAYYFITASKDASVYLQQPNQNTGLDEIIEVSKVYYGNIKDVSRSLIKFDLNVLSNLFALSVQPISVLLLNKLIDSLILSFLSSFFSLEQGTMIHLTPFYRD